MLKRHLLVSPEWTVTNPAIDRMDMSYSDQWPIEDDLVHKVIVSRDRRLDFTEALKLKILPRKILNSFELILNSIRNRNHSVMMELRKHDSSNYSDQGFRRHHQPLLFRIKSETGLVVTLEDGAVEITQRPSAIGDLKYRWRKIMQSLYAQGFVGSLGWASGGGGTHLNFGVRSRGAKVKIFSEKFLYDVYRLPYLRPEIIIALDEFGEHSDACFPLWNHKPDLEWMKNSYDSSESPERFEAYKCVMGLEEHCHFISFKGLSAKKPYLEFRFHRSIESYEDLEALSWFWFYSFAYLMENEISPSPFALKPLDEIPMHLARSSFIDWMQRIDLPVQYQNSLLNLGGSNVFEPIKIYGSEVPLLVHQSPSRLFSRSKLSISPKQGDLFSVNGALAAHHFVQYEVFEDKAVWLRFSNGQEGVLKISPRADRFPKLRFIPASAFSRLTIKKILPLFFSSNVHELIKMDGIKSPAPSVISSVQWKKHQQRAYERARLVVYGLYPSALPYRTNIPGIFLDKAYVEAHGKTLVSGILDGTQIQALNPR